MSDLTIYLYDDATARAWQPFALTRPVGELLLGAYTFRERAERRFGAHCAGHLAADHLLGFEEPGAPPVVRTADVDDRGARIFLNSRAVLDAGAGFDPPDGPSVLVIDDRVAGWYAPSGTPAPDAAWLVDGVDGSAASPPAGATGATPARLGLAGRLLTHVWELVSENATQIAVDVEAADAAGAEDSAAAEDTLRAGAVQSIGYRRGLFRLGAGVQIEPHVVLDFSAGPIWLDDGVTVRAFTRIAGPAYIGRGSTLLGGPFSGVSIGPRCKVHGELEESVILGYSNKAHDGFLGHAYLGQWVNLGALTTNSDLKNNYGSIRMWTPGGETDTGLVKLGCLLGDHVKTGIGALLNTGTVIGAGSNTYGTEMPPKYVPPFSWGSGAELVAFDADRFLQVAETVMARRDVKLSEGMRRVLREAWRIGRAPA